MAVAVELTSASLDGSEIGSRREPANPAAVASFLTRVSAELQKTQLVIDGIKGSISELDYEVMQRASFLGGGGQQLQAEGEHGFGPRWVDAQAVLPEPLVNRTVRNGLEAGGSMQIKPTLDVSELIPKESEPGASFREMADAKIDMTAKVALEVAAAAAEEDAPPLQVPPSNGAQVPTSSAAENATAMCSDDNSAIQQPQEKLAQQSSDPLPENNLQEVSLPSPLGEIELNEHLRAQFTRLDKNGNGILSVQELYLLAASFQDPNGSPLTFSALQRVCNFFDTLGQPKQDGALDFDSFLKLQTGKYDSQIPVELEEPLKALRFALHDEQQRWKIMTNQDAYMLESKREWRKMAFDVAIVCVIAANSLAIGVMQDRDPDAFGWEVLEIIFLIIYTMEAIIKISWFGLSLYLRGPDNYWNLFDVLCLLISGTELIVRYSASGRKDSSWGLLKVLRLARLARLVRLMRFKMFKELKLMLMGLLSGLRALAWAVVLLMVIVYTISIIARTYFHDYWEFESIPNAMFTLFRCFTDTCETYDGYLIPEMLYRRYGVPFQYIYIGITMLIYVGLFNLIMAVFIDNVTKSQNQRKQKELGETALSTEARLKIMLARCVNDPMSGEEGNMTVLRRLSADAMRKLRSLTQVGVFRNQTEEIAIANESFKILQDSNIVITREIFLAWLESPDFVRMLEDADVDVSNKFELFNILDVDHGGELSADELITGLMSLRGDVSKGDVVSILLRVRDLTYRVEQIQMKVCSEDTQQEADPSLAHEHKESKNHSHALGLHAARHGHEEEHHGGMSLKARTHSHKENESL